MTGKTFGRYEIIDEIGRGGMATVYHATDPQFNRDIAIKVLPRELLHDPHFRSRFEQEAKAVAALEHSAIVPVYDYGGIDDQPFLVMRFMSGGSLDDQVKNGPVKMADTVKIIERVAGALDAAHARGVIHRDVKPANIMFDRYGDAYLTDFGLVKMSEAEGGLTGSSIVGTPSYMAPEMTMLGGLSPLVDVYALACTTYQMLVGKLPYEADTPLGAMVAHSTEPLPDISGVNNLDANVQYVLHKGMAKDPTERYQSASEFAADLRAAHEGVNLLTSRPALSSKALGRRNTAVTERISGSDVTGTGSSPAAVSPARQRTLLAILAGALLLAAVLIGFLVLRDSAASATAEATQMPDPTEDPGVIPVEAASPAPADEPTPTEASPTDVPLTELIGGGGPSIVFQSNETGNFEIALLDLLTRDQRRIAPDPTTDNTPAWSPDGTRIVFSSSRGGNTDIYVVDVDGDNLTRLTDHPGTDTDPAWSPDGSQIAFVSSREGNISNIFIMDSDGSNQVRLTQGRGRNIEPAWSPDGSQIAFTSDMEGSFDIFLVSVATGTLRERITDSSFDERLAAWSPDGSLLAYTSNQDGDWELFFHSFETGQSEQITRNTTYDSDPAWSPDGEWLAYSAGQQFRVEQGIAIMRVDGSERELITLTSASFYAELPAWQPALVGE